MLSIDQSLASICKLYCIGFSIVKNNWDTSACESKPEIDFFIGNVGCVMQRSSGCIANDNSAA